MKRRAEFLVEKRDGRQEWLRATKLARSLHLALASAGATELWLAMDLTETVLVAVRKRHLERAAERGGELPPLRTLEIADAVQQVLLATGYAQAAWTYTRIGAERRRRGALLAMLQPGGASEPQQRYAAPRGPADEAIDPRMIIS